MSKQLKYIHKIGLELEGGWDKRRDDLTEDGSVHKQDFSNSVCTGELVSKPFDSLEECLEFLKENWPSETTNRCGFHIHLSYHSINSYNQLMSNDFYAQFLKDMEKWGKNYPCTNEQFWDRLNNKNTFCKKQFIPEKQIVMKQKKNSDPTRYTHLNFCYGIHKTLECRLFPTFISSKTACSALEAFVDCVENYLEAAKPIQEIVEEEVTFDETEVENKKESAAGLFKLKPFNLYSKLDSKKDSFYEKMMKEGVVNMKPKKPIRRFTNSEGASLDQIINAQPMVAQQIYPNGSYVTSTMEIPMSPDEDDN